MASVVAGEPWTAPLPEASPPPGMELYQIPTGSYDTRAAFAVAGGSFRDKRHFAATAVLVRHPRGDLLIDAGFGQAVESHIRMLPRFERAPHRLTGTVDAQLAAAGYDRSNLTGVVLTHAHWDHVSGLDGLDVPIWMNPGELEYAAADDGGKVYRVVSQQHAVHEYELDGPGYLGFPASRDVFGDGAVVLALAGGHTTGSIVVFVTVPDGTRYAFIGDLTWQLDGIRRRAERPWLLRRMADQDPELVRQGLGHLIALEDVMRIVPAHDQRAYETIPPLPVRFESTPA